MEKGGMNKMCDWCNSKDDEFTIVIAGLEPPFNVCADCMNLYGNQEFEKLIEKIKNSRRG